MHRHHTSSDKKKALLAQKERILQDLKYYEKRIEEFTPKNSSVYVDGYSSDSDDGFPTFLDAGPSISELKHQDRLLRTCLQATQELTSVGVLQSEINVMIQDPPIEGEKPVNEPGSWREVAAECRIDLVPFSITFFTHQPSRKFGAASYRGLRVLAVKAAHEAELAASVLAGCTSPSDAIEVLRSYAAAYRSRRTTLARLADKFATSLFMEPLAEGGFVLKCADQLEVSWRLDNKLSTVAPFHHKMKFDLEYMDESHLKVIKQAHRQLSDPNLQTDERTLLLANIISTCLQAHTHTQQHYESMESEPESVKKLERTILNEDDEDDSQTDERRDEEVMAPPKAIPKKAKPKGKENMDENRKSLKRSSSQVDGSVKKARTDENTSSKDIERSIGLVKNVAGKRKDVTTDENVKKAKTDENTWNKDTERKSGSVWNNAAGKKKDVSDENTEKEQHLGKVTGKTQKQSKMSEKVDKTKTTAKLTKVTDKVAANNDNIAGSSKINAKSTKVPQKTAKVAENKEPTKKITKKVTSETAQEQLDHENSDPNDIEQNAPHSKVTTAKNVQVSEDTEKKKIKNTENNFNSKNNEKSSAGGKTKAITREKTTQLTKNSEKVITVNSKNSKNVQSEKHNVENKQKPENTKTNANQETQKYAKESVNTETTNAKKSVNSETAGSKKNDNTETANTKKSDNTESTNAKKSVNSETVNSKNSVNSETASSKKNDNTETTNAKKNYNAGAANAKKNINSENANAKKSDNTETTNAKKNVNAGAANAKKNLNSETANAKKSVNIETANAKKNANAKSKGEDRQIIEKRLKVSNVSTKHQIADRPSDNNIPNTKSDTDNVKNIATVKKDSIANAKKTTTTKNIGNDAKNREKSKMFIKNHRNSLGKISKKNANVSLKPNISNESGKVTKIPQKKLSPAYAAALKQNPVRISPRLMTKFKSPSDSNIQWKVLKPVTNIPRLLKKPVAKSK